MYGPSILQGASAESPVWRILRFQSPYWLGRSEPGFYGNGRMEFPVAELLATMPASRFVLISVRIPNPSPAEIRERAYPFIKHLLTKRPEVPVLLIETVMMRMGIGIRVGGYETPKNDAIRTLYTKLKAEASFKRLSYLHDPGHDHKATADGALDPGSCGRRK